MYPLKHKTQHLSFIISLYRTALSHRKPVSARIHYSAVLRIIKETHNLKLNNNNNLLCIYCSPEKGSCKEVQEVIERIKLLLT
jgi:hypothetical protein